MSKPVLAYLGLGLMGDPMTKRLLAAGYEVHVWNRSKAKLAPALALGAMAAESPRAAVEKADIIMMCLFDAKAVEEVVFGADGVAKAAGSGKVLVDHASIRPDKTRDFAQRLKQANGMEWIDAPVSGGVKGAGEGTLAIMCGGDAAAFERAKPVLAAYGANINLMGPSGAGQVTKLCNQVIVGSNIAVIAEATRYARRVEMAEIEKNDYNLNISRYISTATADAEINLAATHAELLEIEKAVSAATAKHNEYLKELGLPLLP